MVVQIQKVREKRVNVETGSGKLEGEKHTWPFLKILYVGGILFFQIVSFPGGIFKFLKRWFEGTYLNLT